STATPHCTWSCCIRPWPTATSALSCSRPTPAGAPRRPPASSTPGASASSRCAASGACRAACRPGSRPSARGRRRLWGPPWSATAVSPAGACHHCGEPLPATPAVHAVDGVEQSFCCDGCAAAAQWIDEAGLDDYYRLRSEHAGRVGVEAVDLSVWDRSEIHAEHVHEVPGGREITLLTDGMRCAPWAWLTARALVRGPGVSEASANAVTGRIRLAWDPDRTVLSRPLQRLLALGYKPYLASGEEREKAHRAERNRDLVRMGIAGLASMQAMMVAEALYLDFNNTMSIPARDFLRWITFLLSTPVVFYSGWPFLVGAWQELRHRRLGMDTLI